MLLYIEDNHDIAKNVCAYLEADNFQVKRVDNGRIGFELAKQGYYDCIVLDVMLPEMDGFDICRQLRKVKNTPIIMTTAKGEIHDKGEGFSGGADDYLVKPFELAELAMRIQALIHRSQVSDTYTYGEIEISIDENRCVKSGKEVHLTLKERQILIELIDADGLTVSRTDIIETVRGSDDMFDEAGKLDVYIANLRKKLIPGLIETVRGVGYKIST